MTENINEARATPLLTENEAAAFLKVRPQTLAKWRMAGSGASLPFVKVGRSIRYRLSDLNAYLDRHTFNNTVEAYHSRQNMTERGQYVGKP